MRNWLRLSLGLILVAITFWLALRDVAIVDVLRALLAADPWWLAVALPSMMLPVTFVALRMRVLVSGWKESVPWPILWHVTIVGQVANLIVPFRLGDGAKLVAGSRALALPGSTMAVVVTLERLFDFTSASALAALLLTTGSLPGWARAAAATLAVGGGAAILVAAITAILVIRRREAVPAVDAAGLRGTVMRQLGLLREGLARVARRAVLMQLVGATAAIAVASALTNYLLFHAFHLAVPISAAFLLLVVLQLGNTLIPTPGGLGTSQLLAIQTLSLWSVPREDALAYSIALYGIVRLPKLLMLPHAIAALASVRPSPEASRWA